MTAAGGNGRRSRIIVGVTGASGAVYAVRILELLREIGIESHLIVSRAGAMTMKHETGMSVADLGERADVVHAINDVGASCSSGSFQTLGMIVAPCSMRTLAEIASGATSTLLTRSADVVLKERRRLVLMVRETPLTSVHIRNMGLVTEAGAIVAPPVPAFYIRPQSVADLVDHTAGRVLDLFDLDAAAVRRWSGLGATPDDG